MSLHWNGFIRFRIALQDHDNLVEQTIVCQYSV